MIELSTESISVKTQRRTWRTQIESPRGQSPIITGYREEVKINAGDGSVISRDASVGRVDRVIAEIPDQTITLADGTVLTVTQLTEAVRVFLDQCDTEDMAAKAEQAAAAAANPI